MLSDLGYDDSRTSRMRRFAFVRRVAIPGITGFALFAAWPGSYDPWDSVIVGVAAACLLLWPLVFNGLPWGVARSKLVAVYSMLLVAFAGSCWLGAYIARFARADDGIGHFLQENIFSILIGAVVTTFATGSLVRASGAASNERNGG